MGLIIYIAAARHDANASFGDAVEKKEKCCTATICEARHLTSAPRISIDRVAPCTPFFSGILERLLDFARVSLVPPLFPVSYSLASIQELRSFKSREAEFLASKTLYASHQDRIETLGALYSVPEI
jgi:hypothetical protein